MKNIHLIPTDKPSRLHKIGNELGLTNTPNSNFLAKQQNIYITNDEEIKEGDYVYFPTSDEVLRIGNDPFESSLEIVKDNKDCKKIILTTDNEDLIKEGVQKIDDEFLEWFVKNPSCEEVETLKFADSVTTYVYKIIIPKEESN